MARKEPGPGIKDRERYEALRRKGDSKEKAARIANTPRAGERGGRAPPYEEWNKDELYDQARSVGIRGRSRMSRAELIQALRDH